MSSRGEDMNEVYTLAFMKNYDHSQELKIDYVAWLGVFSSKEKAEEALKFYRNLKEYKDYSEECFYIDPWETDILYWDTGFV